MFTLTSLLPGFQLGFVAIALFGAVRGLTQLRKARRLALQGHQRRARPVKIAAIIFFSASVLCFLFALLVMPMLSAYLRSGLWW